MGLAIAAAAPLLVTGFGAHTPVAQPAPAPRVVAVGDVHGSFDAFVEILQTAGLIDAKLRWTGGNTVFVQTGDIFDRGPKVREALDLLMRLEDEAKRAGGRVEFLLGNHEVMNLLHEFRDVSPAAYASFADARSEGKRQRAFEDYVRLVKRRATPGESAPTRDAWMATHPARVPGARRGARSARQIRTLAAGAQGRHHRRPDRVHARGDQPGDQRDASTTSTAPRRPRLPGGTRRWRRW